MLGKSMLNAENEDIYMTKETTSHGNHFAGKVQVQFFLCVFAVNHLAGGAAPDQT